MSTYNLFNGYIGSKAAYVTKIKALFDSSCTKYVEPYIGGGAIYFSNYNGKYEEEWVNDMNPNIANLYMSLADKDLRDDVVKAILSIEKSDNEDIAQALFNYSKGKLLKNRINIKGLRRDERIEWCKHTFKVYSQSLNSSAKNYSKFKSNEKYCYETRRNVINVMERLQTKPMVTCWDGLNVIKKVVEQPETQLFIDWPYVGMYRNSANLYGSEMASLKAHIEGIKLLKNSKAAVVLCGYRSQIEGVPTIYDAILTGEEWHCFKLADTYKHCMVVKNGEPKQKAMEFVWTNRVPEYAGLYLSLVDYKEKLTEQEYWEQIKQACIDRKVQGKHILEYFITYKEVYNKELFAPCIIDEVKKEIKNNR